MAEQNRWSEERSRQSRRYAGDAYSYSDRDNLQRERDDLSARSDDGYGGAYGNSPSFGGQRGQYNSQGARSGGYATDMYGIPSDYSYRGQRVGGYSQGDGQAYSQDSGYEAARYGRGFSERNYADNRQDYGGAYGAGRYQQGDNARAHEDRGFWSQTRDEVSSWFGDDEARRRRELDELRAGEHRGRGPRGYTRSDDRIRDDVNDLLTDNARLDASDIEVAVNAAEVTLSGTVSQRGDKRLAEDLADSILGVKHVQNNLRLKDASAGLANRIPVGAAGSSIAGTTAGSTAGQVGAQTRAN